MKKPAASPIRIFIADDHPVVRDGLAAIIGGQPDFLIVGEAADGAAAVEGWRRVRPDLMLVDLRMPKGDAVEVIGAIREEDPAARVVILTTFDHDEDIYRGLRAGAKAYLLKDCGRPELLRCLRAVHAGEKYLSPQLATKLAGRVGGEQLSTREIDVLRLMAEGKANKEIGAGLFISEGTVKTHVRSILEKLDAVSRTEAVTTAMRRGLLRP